MNYGDFIPDKEILKKRVYVDENLCKDETDELTSLGYFKRSGRDLDGVKKDYWFKPFFRESARHAILVFEIAEFIRDNYTKNVKEYLAKKPDIIFKISDQTWAIEVETGTVFKKNKEQFFQKVRSLREGYGKNWFFVLTNRNLMKQYSVFGKTFTRRNVKQKIDKIIRSEYNRFW